MKISIYKVEDFQHSSWSSGSTSQLYIYPPNSTLNELNFDLRISSAKIEKTESKFTILPGVERKLLILEGRIVIQHENRYTKELNQFETDSFSGGWSTSSIGTCTDFNVMTMGKAESKLDMLAVSHNTLQQIEYHPYWTKIFLFVVQGSVELDTSQETQVVFDNNLVVLDELEEVKIQINGLNESRVVIVYYKKF